jgi:hypothetical protein
MNLVAKAFLFGKDIENLGIHKDRSKAEIKELLEVRQDWLDYGPYGKLHKIIESMIVLKGATNGFLL